MSARPRGTGALEVRRTKSGQDVWYARFRVDGKQQRHRLGVMSKTEAGKQLAKLMANASARPSDSQRKTVDEAALAYIAHVENVRGRKRATIDAYTDILENHIAGQFRGSIDKLTVARVEGWRDELLRSGLAAKSVSNYLTFLGGVCKFAVGKGWAPSNPVESVEKPRVRRGSEIRFLTVEELEAVLRACPDDAIGRVDRAMIRTAAMTGLRMGEILGLRWCDVDFEAEVIRVEQAWSRGEMTTPKSKGSERSVLMFSPVLVELDDLSRLVEHEDRDLVFPSFRQPGQVQDSSAFRRRFKSYVKAAGLVDRKVKVHDLRHTFAVLLARSRVSLQEIQTYMGHSSVVTTQIYSRYAPDHSRVRELAAAEFHGLQVPEVTTVVTT